MEAKKWEANRPPINNKKKNDETKKLHSTRPPLPT